MLPGRWRARCLENSEFQQAPLPFPQLSIIYNCFNIRFLTKILKKTSENLKKAEERCGKGIFEISDALGHGATPKAASACRWLSVAGGRSETTGTRRLERQRNCVTPDPVSPLCGDTGKRPKHNKNILYLLT